MITLPETLVPLFPLASVVLPRGRVPLQLFEPRYLDMLVRCLKTDSGFVVVLLQAGEETDRSVRFHDLGTYVRMVDFHQLQNGLLGITVEGIAKVAVQNYWQQPDGLYVGDIRVLAEEQPVPVPERHAELPSVLYSLCRHPVVRELDMDVNYDDAREVGWRLVELLPLERQEKFRLMALEDPLERLDRLQALLARLEGH